MKTTEECLQQLEQLDGFLEGDDAGVRPIDLLEERGIHLPDSQSLDEVAVGAKLQEVIAAMATLGMYLEFTDHMSDRELYDYLRTDALLVSELLFPDDPAWGCHISPIGGCSEEDIQINLRYYADDDDRKLWQETWPDDEIPPHEDPPYDRDRNLPRHEDRLFEEEVPF